VANAPPRKCDVERVKGVVVTPAVDAHAVASQAGNAVRQSPSSPPPVRHPHGDVAVAQRLGALGAEKPASLGRVHRAQPQAAVLEEALEIRVIALGPNSSFKRCCEAFR
jgi:hypothetical protein